jgi:hypothetical protein
MALKTSDEYLAKTDDLIKFLGQNRDVDFRVFDLQDEENLGRLNFTNFKRKLDEINFLIKAYQRLIRIIPDNDQQTALSLMRLGIHSSLQIAAMTRKDFMKKCLVALEESLADTIYHNALAKRSAILVQYMNMLQNREPHISAARFN